MSAPNTPAPEPTGEERRAVNYITSALMDYSEQEAVKDLREYVAAEVARATAEKDAEIARLKDAYEAAQSEAARLREQMDGEIEDFLNEKACCNGQECGCQGVTRLQQYVHEEAGAELGSLRTERDALQAQVRVLREALQDADYAMHAIAKLKPSLVEHCYDQKKTDAALATTSTGKPTEKDAEEWRDAPTPPAVIAEWRKDKERLDWLDKQGESETFEDAPHATIWTLIHAGKNDIRAAIDAAVQESRKERA